MLGLKKGEEESGLKVLGNVLEARKMWELVNSNTMEAALCALRTH